MGWVVGNRELTKKHKSLKLELCLAKSIFWVWGIVLTLGTPGALEVAWLVECLLSIHEVCSPAPVNQAWWHMLQPQHSEGMGRWVKSSWPFSAT